jgi:enoyl-CoA hydratase/carnithine racemase
VDNGLDEMAGHADLEVKDRIAWITIANPGRMNAIDPSLASDLLGITSGLLARADINLVVLQGADERAFSAGIDLKYIDSIDDRAAAFAHLDDLFASIHDNILRFEIPTVTLLRGVCYGAGVHVAALSDFRLAAEDLRLAVPAIRNNLYYPVSALQRLEEVMGLANTRRLIFNGTPIEPSRLLAWGFLDQVHAPDTFEERAATFIDRIAAFRREVIVEYKKIFNALGKRQAAEADAIRSAALARQKS